VAWVRPSDFAIASVERLAISTSSRLSIAILLHILRFDGLLEQFRQAVWQCEMQLLSRESQQANQALALGHNPDAVHAPAAKVASA